MHIGDKIRELRVRKGLTQEAVADSLGMSLTNYGYIEQGRVNVNIPKLEKIANFFETDIFELISLGEKNVYYVNTIQDSTQSGLILTQNNYQDQLLAQENQFLKEKLHHLESKIQDLEEIIALMKR